MYPFLEEIVERPLGSINLFSVTEDTSDMLARSLRVTSNFLSSEDKELIFRVDDPRSIDTITLLFFITQARGNLIITLNNREIFNGPATNEDLPIRLPNDLLQSINRLTFAVDSPGFNFFRTQSYALADVQLFRTLRVENMREPRTFVLTQDDRRNLQQLRLFYFVNCFTVTEQSRLTIYLNRRVVQDGLIVCDAAPVSLDLNPRDLVNGQNVLEFEIDHGQYVLERVLLEQVVDQGDYPDYFFTLQVHDLDYLFRGGFVSLETRFLQDGFRKTGTLFVNGFPLYIDTFEDQAFFDITPYVTDGQNVIRIVPLNEFTIVSLDVLLG